MYKIRPNTPVLAKFAYMKKVNFESVVHIYVLQYIIILHIRALGYSQVLV